MEIINEEKIVSLLQGGEQDLKICVYDLIDSTNSQAKRMFSEGDRSDKLIVARSQSGGRGRLGRSFYSPAEGGIYMTLAYTTDEMIADAVSITSAAAVAVCSAICMNTGVSPDIKWVNDLYLNGKKICGILAESVVQANSCHIILGIGINLNTKNFPQQLREIAGSIGAECDPNKLIADIVNELFKFLYGKADFMPEYRKRSMVLGKTVLCTRGNESYLGVAEKITDKGALLVRCTNGDLICMDSGEISLRLTETSV